MNTLVFKKGRLDSYDLVTVTPEDAVAVFNYTVKKNKNKLHVEAIVSITKDIYYKINVAILSQNRSIDLVTQKNSDRKYFSNPILVSDPWDVNIQTDKSYKNSGSVYTVDDSEKIIVCDSCEGIGKTICPKCDGQGLILCSKCKGVNSIVITSTAEKKGVVGRSLVGALLAGTAKKGLLGRGLTGTLLAGTAGMFLGGATGKKRTTTSAQVCPTCRGRGTLVCQNCAGEGIEICENCEGVGNLIQFQQINVNNKSFKKRFKINTSNNSLARQELPESTYEAEFEGEHLDLNDLRDIPPSELEKFKNQLHKAISVETGKILKFKINISSLPIFRVTYNSKGKRKNFKLIGSNLRVEKGFFDKLLDLPLSPVELYAAWNSLNLLRKSGIVGAFIIFFLILIYIIIEIK